MTQNFWGTDIQILRDRHSNGFSVVIVLVMLAVITSLALAGAGFAMQRQTQAAYYAERVITRHAALSGIEAGKHLLIMDQTPWDGPGDPWFNDIQFPLNEISVTVQITDEQASISLNHLILPSREIHTPLMDATEKLVPEIPDFASEWQTFVKELQDTSDQRHISFDAFIDFMETHYRNRPLTEERKQALNDIFTPFGASRINLNTADASILRALGGSALENAVVAHRTSGPIESVFHLSDASELLRGLTHSVDVKSSFFTITATASGQFVSGRAETAVWRRGTDLVIIRHREWWM